MPANNFLEPVIVTGTFVLTLLACLVVWLAVSVLLAVTELYEDANEDEDDGRACSVTPTPPLMPTPTIAEPSPREQRRLLSDAARREWYPTLDRLEAQRLAQAGNAHCFAFESERTKRRCFVPLNLN